MPVTGYNYTSARRTEGELMNPSVSVIVPAYNEEVMIAGCLRALLCQDYDGPYEVVVVDNGSTDATAEVARSFGDDRIRVVGEPRRGYVHALLRGVAEARGEILAFTDADTQVGRRWLSRLVSCLMQEGVVACSGVFEFLDGPAWLRWTGRVAGRLNWHLAGANMAVWRQAYEEAGGFDPQVNLGADLELDLRLRRTGKVVIDRTLVVSTSARRFVCAPVSSPGRYLLNDISLVLRGRPLFSGFPNYRPGPVPVRYRPAIGVGLSVFLVAVFLLLCELPGSQIFGHVVSHGGPVRAVALTFDDGPSPATRQVLDILDAYHIRATFFFIGKNAAAWPDLAREAQRRGHAIGNHTWSHPLLAPVESVRAIDAEIERASDSIQRTAGVSPAFFRPPHGWRSPLMMRECRRRGLTVVTWTIDAEDWKGIPPDELVARVVRSVRPGSIILLHDGRGTALMPDAHNTVEALPRIIEGLANRGYHFVTVPDLIGVTGVGAECQNSARD